MGQPAGSGIYLAGCRIVPMVTAGAPSKPKKRSRPVARAASRNFNFIGTDKDKGSDWRAQLLMQRHHVSASLCGLIAVLHYGEMCDAA